MVNWKAFRKDRKLLRNSPNSHGLLGKEIPMFWNALLRIYFRPWFRFGHQIFAFCEPTGWTSRAFWISHMTCNHKYCCEYESDLLSNEHYLSGNKIRPENFSGLYGIWTHELCDSGAVLITARIAFIFTSLSAVQIYYFHMFTVEILLSTRTARLFTSNVAQWKLIFSLLV